MEIIKINRGDAENLFDYWEKIGKNVPYFYNTTYGSFAESLFDDKHNGTTILKDNNIFIAREGDTVKGFIQYGIPTFHYAKTGKITEDVNIGVIRNLYYDENRPDIGRELLDLSLNFFKDNNIDDIYAFYHAMGMSCNGNHGKLHESFHYIDKLLCDKGFQVEHENIYYISDMSKKNLEYRNNTYIKIYDVLDNSQKFILYDENNKELGTAKIKYIDNLTGNIKKDIIYLVWIGIDNNIKGKGLGTEFLNHIIKYCLRKGYKYLHTDTALNNTTAKKFYLRNGFINKGVTRSYLTKINRHDNL